jgi:L-asparaginase
MQVKSANDGGKIVVLGTGGTIAGRAAKASDNLAYTAAQVGVGELLDAIPGLTEALAGRVLVVEQVAQIDSRDMNFAVWQQLASRVSHHLAHAEVHGVVITHGTDTLEETAFFLHSVLPVSQLVSKPVVLTCAMRPVTSAAPDGPQNVLDAVAVLNTPGACGVLAVCAGTVHGALEVQKVHPYRLDAFDSGDVGPVGYVEEGCFRLVRNWPLAMVDRAQVAIEKIVNAQDWPRVEIVMNYAGASGAVVDALLSHSSLPDGAPSPVRGLVAAGTGNGTLHHDLEAALIRAQAAGVKVLRATRCASGRVLSTPGNPIPDSQGLSPVKARVALMLTLMQ